MNEVDKARHYAAGAHYRCALAALAGEIDFPSHMTKDRIEDYIIRDVTLAIEIEQGKHDHNFTVWQRMNYYLTGECVPLLK